MIEERQEQLDTLYAATFGSDGETGNKPVAGLVLDPNAQPPEAKLNKLLQIDAFRLTYEHKREDLASLSEYDLSLANYTVRDEWYDQEIANLLISFRRNNGDEKDLKKALRLDYISGVIDKARHSAAECETASVGGKDKKRQSVATRLLDLAEDIELFHTPDRMTFAVIKQDGHTETWPLESRTVKDYLARRYHEKTGSAPSSQALQDVLNVLRGHALFAGREEPVYTRVAGYGGKIYLDLCNSDWSVVEITSQGWRVIQSPPVHFVRSRGMTSLPTPQKNK